MQTATCQEEMPSVRQVQQLSGAQGEEATGAGGGGGRVHFAWAGGSFCFVPGSGYLDLAKASPVWPIPSSGDTSPRSV